MTTASGSEHRIYKYYDGDLEQNFLVENHLVNSNRFISEMNYLQQLQRIERGRVWLKIE